MRFPRKVFRSLKKRLIFFSLAFVIGAYGGVSADAVRLETLWGPTSIGNAKGLIPLTDPIVATDVNGVGWVVWRASREGIPQYFTQQFDAEGNLRFPLEGISLFQDRGEGLEAKLAVGVSQDAFAVVRSHADGKVVLRLQHISSRGRQMLGPSGLILSSPTAEARSFDIASSPNGLCIAWTERYQDESRLYRAFFRLGEESVLPNFTLGEIAGPGGNPRDVKIFSRGEKGFYMVWLEQKSRTADWDLRMQALDAEGRPQWGEKGRYLSEGVADQRDFTGLVVEDDLFVFWTDFRNGNSDIFGARVNRFGENQWDANGSPIILGAGRQQFPKVHAGKGRSLWVVAKTYQKDTWTEVYQKVDFVGRALLGWEGKLAPKGMLVWEGQAERPHKIALANVEWGTLISLKGSFYLLTKESIENVDQLFLRRVDQDLGILGKRQQIARAVGDVQQRTPRLLPLTDGAFFLVWTDSRLGIPAIFANVITREGDRRWPKDLHIGPNDLGLPVQLTMGEEGYYVLLGQRLFFVNASGEIGGPTDGVSFASEVLASRDVRLLTSGEFAILVWGEGGNIFAQKVSADGKLWWGGSGRVVCDMEGVQRKPDAVGLPNGQLAVAWEDNRLGEETTDIYAERLSADGEPLWRPGRGVPVCTVPGVQRDVHIVSLPKEQFILVWKDESGGNVEVYADLLGESGESLWQKDGWMVGTLRDEDFDLDMKSISDGNAVVFGQGRNGVILFRPLVRNGNRVSEKSFQELFPASPFTSARASGNNIAALIRGNDIQGVSDVGVPIFSSVQNWISGPYHPHAVQLEATEKNEWVIVWEELRGSDFDIYGARLRIQ